MTPLPAKTKAPDFPLERPDAAALSKLKGKEWAVIYFYPRDNTPGCTLEAQQFRDLYPEFRAIGVEVIGISTQGAKSHAGFAEKHCLPFPLVPDSDKAIASAYGVLNMMGAANRVTFLVGKDGVIARTWPTVKARGHAAEVLETVKGMMG